jgi:hypothetical protein
MTRAARLTVQENADIMSDMTIKTFTVRELDRSPAVVLDAAEAEGVVLVRRRDGRTYRIQPEAVVRERGKIPDFRARMDAPGMPRISRRTAETVDRWMVGE